MMYRPRMIPRRETRYPDACTHDHKYSADDLERGRRRRRIEDILEAARLERSALDEVCDE